MNGLTEDRLTHQRNKLVLNLLKNISWGCEYVEYYAHIKRCNIVNYLRLNLFAFGNTKQLYKD